VESSDHKKRGGTEKPNEEEKKLRSMKMKKTIFLVLTLMLISIGVFAQTEAKTNDGRKVLLNDDGTYTWVATGNITEAANENTEGEYYIGKHIDDMTDKVYYYSSKNLICQDKAKGVGFNLSYQLSGKTDNTIKISGLSLKIVGLECLENTELLFLFDDSSKLSIKSWNDFNCKGNAWYQLTSSQTKQLGSKTINKIRVQNGRNYKSYTHELEGEDKSYLINIFKSVEAKDIRAKQLKD